MEQMWREPETQHQPIASPPKRSPPPQERPREPQYPNQCHPVREWRGQRLHRSARDRAPAAAPPAPIHRRGKCQVCTPRQGAPQTEMRQQGAVPAESWRAVAAIERGVLPCTKDKPWAAHRSATCSKSATILSAVSERDVFTPSWPVKMRGTFSLHHGPSKGGDCFPRGIAFESNGLTYWLRVPSFPRKRESSGPKFGILRHVSAQMASPAQRRPHLKSPGFPLLRE